MRRSDLRHFDLCRLKNFQNSACVVAISTYVEEYFNEPLLSHDEESDNDNLLSINNQHALEDDVRLAMQLISHVLDIFSDNNKNHSSGGAASSH